MKAENSFVAIILAGLAALIVFAVYMYLTDQLEFLFFIAVVVLLALLIVGTVAYVVFGAYYMVKQKDTVHYESSMTLDDVTPVEGEMEKKQ